MKILKYQLYLFVGILLMLTGFILLTTSQNKMEKELREMVTKEGGTEPAFENEYWDEKRPGIYTDYNTGDALFSSLDKYDSGTGWPSFTKPINESMIKRNVDISQGMKRVEIKTDESHLGHVFNDGPDGGDRFCVNSAALKFIPYEDLDKEGYSEYKELFPYEEIVLAGGCFWGVEYLLEETKGVISATSGYANGNIKNPTYQEVSSGETGSAEAVKVVFDSSVISFEEILDIFWRLHNPTELNRQGPDIGTQYRSAIFYSNDNQKKIAEASKIAFDNKKVFDLPAATLIEKLEGFYPAEDYHQDYIENNPGYVCHALRSE